VPGLSDEKSTYQIGTCYGWVWIESGHVSSNDLIETGNMKSVSLGEDSIMHSGVDENLLFVYPSYVPVFDEDAS
jgi:hypothetical protein